MRIRFTTAAAADNQAILDYLSTRSLQGKTHFEARLAEVLINIREYPLTGRNTNRRGVRIATTHPFPYLIYYRPSSLELIVLRILHGARSPGTMPARPR